EMRHLITSLQNHTTQLKGENARIKKKLKESNVEIGRLKAIIESNGLKVCCGGYLLPDPKVEHPPPPSTPTHGGGGNCSAECKDSKDVIGHAMSDSSNDGLLVMASEDDVKVK